RDANLGLPFDRLRLSVLAIVASNAARANGSSFITLAIGRIGPPLMLRSSAFHVIPSCTLIAATALVDGHHQRGQDRSEAAPLDGTIWIAIMVVVPQRCNRGYFLKYINGLQSRRALHPRVRSAMTMTSMLLGRVLIKS